MLKICWKALLLAGTVSAEPKRVARFGIVTDVHYANATTGGSRFYKDSLNKMRDATETISNANADFLIELGDFKDTTPDQNVINTVSFLEDIENSLGGFKGPKFHVLGNHVSSKEDLCNTSSTLTRPTFAGCRRVEPKHRSAARDKLRTK